MFLYVFVLICFRLGCMSSLYFTSSASELYFLNSSSTCHRVRLFPNPFKYSVVISSSSALLVSESSVTLLHTLTVPISLFGKITFDGIHIDTPHLTLPLVSCDISDPLSFQSEVSLEQSTIANLEINSSFITGRFSTQLIYQCRFSNISQSDLQQRNCYFYSVSHSFLRESLFDQCTDTVYGTLLSSGSSQTLQHLTCINNTFSSISSSVLRTNRCMGHHLPQSESSESLESITTSSQKITETETLSSSCSYSFVLCNFTGITAEDETSVLYFIGSASESLSLDRCTFTDCATAGSGGCITAENLSSFISYQTNFTNVSASTSSYIWSGGALHITYHTSCLSIRSSTFTICRGYYGGALLLYNSQTADSYCIGSPGRGTISDCVFDDCRCKGSAGWGGVAAVEAGGRLTWRSCSFSHCSATTSGGAFYFYYNTDPNDLMPMFYSCSFLQCTAPVAPILNISTYRTGNCIYGHF